LDSLRRHRQHGITTEIFHGTAENSPTRGKNCVTIFVAVPGTTRLPRTALPSLVNGGKSGRTAGIGDMTASIAIITGHGIADNGLDGDLDFNELITSFCGPSHDFGPWDGPLFSASPLSRYFSRNILFSSFDLSKYIEMAAPTQSNHQLTAI
jgi:hypothetical protein